MEAGRGEVKIEAAEEEEEEAETLPDNRQEDLQESAGEDQVSEAASLAQLALTPIPHLPSPSTGKMKKKDRDDSKAKNMPSVSKLKHAASNQSGKNQCCKKKNSAVEGSPTDVETKSAAMIRAEEFQSNLEPGFPSFVKALVRSHVSSCFWMGLPGSFCREHLPRADTSFTLEDEDGKKYEVKYIAHKTGLSAGWRQFSIEHNLVEGDVSVFQLVNPCKFKLYIIKADNFTEVDGALGLLNLDAPIKVPFPYKNNVDNGAMANRKEKRKHTNSTPLSTAQKKNKHSQQKNPRDHSCNNSEEVGSEVLEGTGTKIQLKDMKHLDRFMISVDGVVIDSEIPDQTREKYYQLCCTQNAFLHKNLFRGINVNLIIGAISETVKIADSIMKSNLTTTRDEFSTWDRALKAVEILGMNVRFLRRRVKRLLNLAFECENAVDTRSYIGAKRKRGFLEEEIKNLEVRMVELEEATWKFDNDIENLKPKVETFELNFLDLVRAPW